MHATSPMEDSIGPEAAGSAGRRWEGVRIGLGAVYLLGALAHVALGLFAPEVYRQFADQALLDVYGEGWRTLVVPALPVLQPLVIVFEGALAVALLWRGRAVVAGHAAGAAFQAALVLSGPWGPINAALAAVHLAALRQSYPVTVPDLVRSRFERGERA